MKPRVMFVLPASVMGGAEIRLLGMLDSFTRIEPLLLGHRELIGHLASRPHVRFFDDFPACRDPYPYAWDNARVYARAVAETARDLRPDLTFGWMHNGAMFVALAATLYGLGGRLAGSVLGPPSEHFRFQGLKPSLYERAFFAFAFQRLHGVIVPSAGTRHDLIRHFHAPARRVVAIYNGVDIALVRAKGAAGAPPLAKERPWILAASRLSLEKGFDVQLRAFALARERLDAHYVILGEGPQRPAIAAEVARLGLEDRVSLVGFQDNPLPWIARADVFLMASRLEGFGNAIVEAMALGVPVVSTACPYGPREIIQDGVNGLLCPVDDAHGLARRLISVLCDPGRRATLSRGARARAETFSKRRMIAAYEDYLRALC